jgi:hypothetical protein
VLLLAFKNKVHDFLLKSSRKTTTYLDPPRDASINGPHRLELIHSFFLVDLIELSFRIFALCCLPIMQSPQHLWSLEVLGSQQLFLALTMCVIPRDSSVQVVNAKNELLTFPQTSLMKELVINLNEFVVDKLKVYIIHLFGLKYTLPLTP